MVGLANLAIKRPVFISCIVLLSLILGVFSFFKMPVDLFPDVTIPVIFIQIPYPGASPLDVEKLLAKPIEDELGGVAGLKNMTTNNLDSFCVVILEFRLGTDIREAEQTVRNRLGNIRSQLPSEMKEPIIKRFDPADQPVVSLVVTKLDSQGNDQIKDLGEGEMFDLANEQIKPMFERVNGVGSVELLGGRKSEIHIDVDKSRLQDYRLSMLQVAKRIEETSKDVPIGRNETKGTQDILMRSSGEFKSLQDIQNVTVSFLGSDVPIKLKNIAKVTEGLEEANRLAKYKGVSALMLDVFRQVGSNAVQVSDDVKNAVGSVNEYLKRKNLNLAIHIVRDSSLPIRMNIADVRDSIIIGILLCVTVVFLFLGSFRSTFITGMALPNSLLGGFLMMYAMGFSINIMTLLALSLAVGLLIDDAIVVRESIFRHIELGEDPKTASLKGTSEVALAVIATTLVVIAVFGPIAFLKGMVGQFFKQFGLTIVFTMLISLFDAFTVAPMLSTYMAGRKHKHKSGDKGSSKDKTSSSYKVDQGATEEGAEACSLQAAQADRPSNDGLRSKWSWDTHAVDQALGRLERFHKNLELIYERTIRNVLQHRLSTLFGAFLIFAFSIFLIKYIPKTFLPSNDIGEFLVTLEWPAGTKLEQTEKGVDQLDQLLRGLPGVDYTRAIVGSRNNESFKGEIYVQLLPRGKRNLNTSEFKDLVRGKFDERNEKIRFTVSDVDIAGGGEKPFNLNLVGEDLKVLSEYSEKLKVRMQKIPGVVDLDTNFRTGQQEFHIVFDREKTENLGVSTVMAGSELRFRTEGAKPAIFRRNGLEYQIRARLRGEDRDLQQEFNRTAVPNQNFDLIPLNRISVGESSQGFAAINRQNKNRFINISSNLSKNGALDAISNETLSIIKDELPLPSGVEYRFFGQAEDFQELMVNMMMALGLAIIFIYLVLASLYESFIVPFTILLALPFAISGAMIGLYLTNKTIDIFSLIGIIMLLGVVAKNSILLVDCTLQQLALGMSQNEAILTACKTRLRPILMTSIALIAGTIPVALGMSEASRMRTSMGVVIIGGLISSTFLTLVVVPAAFGYVDDFRNLFRKKGEGA